MTAEERKEKRRIQCKERYDRLKAAHLCVICGGPLDREGTYCTACSDRMKSNYKYKQERGICPKCGAEMPNTRKLCETCRLREAERKKARRDRFTESEREYQKQYQKQLRENRKAAGICMSCGKRPAMTGHVECIECRARRKRHYTPSPVWGLKRATGICLHCDKPALPGRVYCAYHLQKAQDRMQNARNHTDRTELKKIINAEFMAYK